MQSSQAGKYAPPISLMGEQPARPASNAAPTTYFVLATLEEITTKLRRMAASNTFNDACAAWLTAACFGALSLGGCTAIDPLKTAPASMDQPWKSSETNRLAKKLDGLTQDPTPPKIDLAHTYKLVDLVDLAQRSNRTTRVAWQAAREAAVGVGLSQAEFYPILVLLTSYGGGLWDLDINFNNVGGLPLPNDLIGAVLDVLGGQLPQNIDLDLEASGAYRLLNTGAALRWMLFDFGARRARMTAAQRAQIAANLTFNAAHQAVTFKVLESYYAWQAAKGQLAAATSASEAAKKLAAAAGAKAEQGLVTQPLLLQARQAEAEAEYAVQTTRAAAEVAWVDVAEAVGIPPGMPVKVASADYARLEQELQKPLDAHLRAALSTRPDLLAKVAVVQAKEAQLRAARADLLPKLSLTGLAGYTRFDTTVRSAGPLEEMGFGLQNYGGFLTVQWPIFTGFGEENKVRLADTQRQAAVEELALAKEKTIAEVWRAYTRAKNALARQESAEGLVKATRASYDAALAGFNQGLVSIQDVLTAQAAWSQAIALQAQSDSAIGATLAALAFGSGKLEAAILRGQSRRP
jgi:outer membrane protein